MDGKLLISAQPAHNEPPPLLFINLVINECSSLDPKTVCVEKSEVYQAEQLIN